MSSTDQSAAQPGPDPARAPRPAERRALWPPRRWFRRRPQVTVLRLYGVIGPPAGGLRGSRLNLEALAGPIEEAFKPKGLAAVALAINSPGGAPMQSAAIAGRIRQLADEKNVPVIAFAEDVAASGGYWLACAADEIYADRASILGSIGVIAAGFGAQGLLEKLGLERRVHTAGTQKSFLDPFLPERAEDVARLKDLQNRLHEAFTDWVRARRGTKLAADREAELFSGAFWLGGEAQALGLVDGIGDLRSVMRARFGKNVRLRPIRTRSSWLQRRMGLHMDRQGGPVSAADWAPGLAVLPERILAAVEDRLLWNRFGL
ncbi:S49 family peptidase [Marinibaculum pumilum]|uniref:S49 family peptidase n=1 Tax=Marinibaculum pumilum TaxID=1766165 RepID=A0ABV7LA72_9PROT